MFTKTDIEILAKEIQDFLGKYEIADSTSIYYNNKVVRSKTKGGEYSPNGEYIYKCEWETTDNVDPHDYFEYAAYNHILSMSFEGGLYDVLNYSFGRREEEFQAIFEKHGLYFELGNAWNLSVYPRDDMEVEYTIYEEPKEIIQLHRWNFQNNPLELQRIMDEWYVLSKTIGDVGSCVLGAGFSFEWENEKYFMNSCSPYLGSISWETHKDEIQQMLENIGAINIQYEWGRMD